MTQVMYVIHLASRIITANASNFKYWMLCELVHTEPKRGVTPSRKTKRGAPRRHFIGRGPLLFRWWGSVMKSARKHDTKSRHLAGAGEELKLSSYDMRERLAPWGQIGLHQSKGNISRVHGYQVCNEFRRRYFIFAYHPISRRCTIWRSAERLARRRTPKPPGSKSATFDTVAPWPRLSFTTA